MKQQYTGRSPRSAHEHTWSVSASADSMTSSLLGEKSEMTWPSSSHIKASASGADTERVTVLSGLATTPADGPSKQTIFYQEATKRPTAVSFATRTPGSLTLWMCDDERPASADKFHGKGDTVCGCCCLLHFGTADAVQDGDVHARQSADACGADLQQATAACAMPFDARPCISDSRLHCSPGC